MGCIACKSNPKNKIQSNLDLSTDQDRISSHRIIKIKTKDQLSFNPSLFVGLRKGNIEDNYIFEKTIHTGSYGLVRLALNKITSLKRAIKTISKEHIGKDMKLHAQFYSEIDILKQTDHPNIIKLYEFYEDAMYYHLVTEYIPGGELFDYIIKSKMLSEPIAAQFMRQLLSAVAYCHLNNIVHRDLKPENLLIDAQSQEATLKVIDFGLSAFYDSKVNMTKQYGTSYYVAPEVLRRNYNEKCDIWSCGVILYILLSGRPPFNGNSSPEIVRRVQKGEFSFEGPSWDGVTPMAKKLIKRMLDYDPNTRISANEALTDEWIIYNASYITRDENLTQISLWNLKTFRVEQKLQRAVLTYIASQISNKEEIKQLGEAFRDMDTNGDGKLSKEEVLEAFYTLGGNGFSQKDIEDIIRQVDVNNSGYIDYTEFIMATARKESLLCIENLDSAFKAFDEDGSGKISAIELKNVFGKELIATDEVWKEMINEVDENGDGEIDLTEFRAMMTHIFDNRN
ncbi:unnamed protein product [Blepharisma stoltei]|uniref:Calcium-dependent protein kinase 1 n=1 Tax=Blepharisma stoltei TaxID=1481888 RepID=A0AAU9INA5_9CILI|nr:unnamed protein product [Blepharisma stoltei]